MVSRLPSKPGWYRDPDNPRVLRHWDGTGWGERSRRLPAWSRGVDLFLADDRPDRSAEGPVHPNELREPVASVGGWSREWLPWRPRQLDPGWPRATSHIPPRQPGAPRSALAPRLSPARRPLLAMMCLLVVAVAVVISSVAFITPYEVRRNPPAPGGAVATRFVQLADYQCTRYLPNERDAFLSTAAPALEKSAAGMDTLRVRVSRLHYSSQQVGKVEEWLNALRRLARDQRQYARSLGAPVSSGVIGPAPNLRKSVDVASLRSDALQDASKADTVSDGLALGPACQMSLGH